MKQIIILLIISFFISFSNNAYNQITRGAEEDELYISTDWYMDNTGHVHYAIFHSTNNGANIHLKYENIETPPEGEMNVGGVLGDATPGALYNYGNNELWVSFDYGVNWEYREDYPDNTYYLSGINNGIIYKTSFVKLHRSENYGENFEIITDPLTIPIPEIGFSDGEFFGINGDAGIGFELVHTYNNANNYTIIPIDSAVAFWAPGGHWPKISRGTEPGEIYLVSWWLNSNYKIFHSVDTGYTWTEKFESDYIDIYYWRVAYTAGREPGSFYVLRSRINPQGDHVWLYIDFSSDYGETFTTYFHDLDSLFTSVGTYQNPTIELEAYPNPFSESTTIHFNLPEKIKNPVLVIYDFYGKKIIQYDINGKIFQKWNGKDNYCNPVPSGAYFYYINYGNLFSKFNKLIIIN
jgi:hypothetical protein